MLTQSIIIFAVSALCVVFAGIGLAFYGDELAAKTGYGTLWIGTVLVSVVTSLPELVVSITSVCFEHSPGLALGNVFGANMINICVLAAVVILFRAGSRISLQKSDSVLLIMLGLVLVALAWAFGKIPDIKLGPSSVGGLLILAVYLSGMRVVYNLGQKEKKADGSASLPEASGSARKTWLKFAASAVVVIIAGRFLSFSANNIASCTGIGSSFVGVLLLALVTTLPETSVSVTAMLRKSYGIVLGNVYGSCAFNVSIFTFADLFTRDAPLLSHINKAHEAAAAGALLLMALGFAMLKVGASPRWRWAKGMAFLIPLLYVLILYQVFALSGSGKAT